MLPSKEFFRSYAKKKGIPWQERNILVEYLQTQILKTLSLSDYNDRLAFLGGTCLRFAYGIDRFSEDLDFDLVKKDSFDVDGLAVTLGKRLESQGFEVEVRTKTTDHIHVVSIRFKNVLREFGLSVPKDEKILVKFEIYFDPYRNIRTETKFADSFNERFPMLVNSIDTLFAQKVLAITFRPYQKGRDFYDLVWFLSQRDIEPNYAIFREKGIDIGNRPELIAFLEEKASSSDLKQASKDVERFLFHPEQAQWILRLPEYLEGFRN